MKKSGLMLLIMTVLIIGCGKQSPDPRIKVQEGVASDTLANNVVTKPVIHAFSALIGERIEVKNAVLRRNNADILELQVELYNNSFNTEKFQYRVEWVDADGLVINSSTNVWIPKSVSGKSRGTIMAAAPNAKAVDFRMNTRNQE